MQTISSVCRYISEGEELISLPCGQVGQTEYLFLRWGYLFLRWTAVLPQSPASCPGAFTLWTCCWSDLVVSGPQIISKGEKQLKIYPTR